MRCVVYFRSADAEEPWLLWEIFIEENDGMELSYYWTYGFLVAFVDAISAEAGRKTMEKNGSFKEKLSTKLLRTSSGFF